MECPFCAEEIKEKATVCRFCGAEKQDGKWARPALPTAEKKSITLLVSGYFYLLSAAFEIAALFTGNSVPLFGQLRNGALAACYHISFTLIYTAMGIGLLRLNRRGYAAFWIGTLCFTFMQGLYILDHSARAAEIKSSVGGLVASLGIDLDLLSNAQLLEAWLVLGCWWSFAVYVYFQRERFK